MLSNTKAEAYDKTQLKNKRCFLYNFGDVRLFADVDVRQARGRSALVSEGVFQEFYRADFYIYYDAAR